MACEARRGCGFRKVGGLYLVSDGPVRNCCRLPVPLDVCKCCGQGIKQTRGWTWVSPELLGDKIPDCETLCSLACPSCLGERVGLLWIGEKFYSTPQKFTDEAAELGVSRRIHAVCPAISY